MSKLEDLKFELTCYLTKAGCNNSLTLLEQFEAEILKHKSIQYKYFGVICIPLDLYNACKLIVPKEKLESYIQRIYHLLNTCNRKELFKIQNNVVNQFISLYEEYSNVNTQEAERNYN